jgi:hypothetical protein
MAIGRVHQLALESADYQTRSVSSIAAWLYHFPVLSHMAINKPPLPDIKDEIS